MKLNFSNFFENSKLVFILSGFLLFLPFLTKAACYSATGFGDSGVNGTYTESTTYNSELAYSNGTNYLYNWGSGYYAINNTLTGSLGKYYRQTSIAGNWSVTNWNGTPPAGSVSSITCPTQQIDTSTSSPVMFTSYTTGSTTYYTITTSTAFLINELNNTRLFVSFFQIFSILLVLGFMIYNN